MKARWDGMLAGRDAEGRSFKAFLGSSARTGLVFKDGQVVNISHGEHAPMTEAEQERARIVSLIRETEAEYAREAARLRCGSRRDPRWDDWARAVHKRSMARVLALKIERGE